MVIITSIINSMFCCFFPPFFVLLCFSFCFFFLFTVLYSDLSRLVCFVLFCLFVSLFVIIKPENLFFVSYLGLEVNPLGVYPLGSRSSSCGPTKGTPPPLFVCLFMFFCFVGWNKTRKTILRLLREEGSKPPGSDYTRAAEQTTCITKTAVQTTYVSIYG